MQRHFPSKGFLGIFPKVASLNNKGREEKEKDSRSALRKKIPSNYRTKPRKEYFRNQQVGENYRTMTSKSCWNSMQNRVKIHYVFPNRNLMLHPTLWVEEWSTGFRKIKQSKQTKCSCNQQLAWQSIGGRKDKVAFSQQLVPQFFPLCPDFLQVLAPFRQIVYHGIHKPWVLSESPLPSSWTWRMEAGHAIRNRNSVLLGYNQIMCKRFPWEALAQHNDSSM